MKAALVLLFASASLIARAAAVAPHDPHEEWFNRPNVIFAGQTLQQEVEHFDEAMHDTHAPDQFIGMVHHFEDTVGEFVTGVRGGMPYFEAMHEFDHIRADVKMLKNEIDSHPQLLASSTAVLEWRHLWSSYRKLDHEMFVHLNRLSQSAIDQIERDFAEVLAAH